MPSSSTTATRAPKEGTGRLLDIIMKVLSGLVLPLIVWGVRLEVTNAIQNERISELQRDFDNLADVTDSVQKNSLALVRLEGKLDNVNEKINEVKTLLLDRGQ